MLGPCRRALLELAAGALGAMPLAFALTPAVRKLAWWLLGYGIGASAYFLASPLGPRHGPDADVTPWRQDADWYILTSDVAFLVTAVSLLRLALRREADRG